MKTYLFLILIFSLLLSFSSAEECGRQAGGALCPNHLCCSGYGWCGDTEPYCQDGCQSQCDLSHIISRSQFEDMLKHRNNALCPARGFFTYDAFITAAKSFPDFGTTGDTATSKKEVAAFLAQTSHDTTGGWPNAPDGPYAWGYCFKPDSWGYCFKPELVANDSVIAFKDAICFWMTAQPSKPSCHAVIAGEWQPSEADRAAGRLPGYGVITNIINGGLECGNGVDLRGENRIGFYKRYCNIFGVNPGVNLDCYNQSSFGNVFLDAAI